HVWTVPLPRSLSATLSPYTPLFRSCMASGTKATFSRTSTAAVLWLIPSTRRDIAGARIERRPFYGTRQANAITRLLQTQSGLHRSEEHTSELQSRENLVCRLLLEKK